MELTVAELKFLQDRKQEIRRELDEIGSPQQGPHYFDAKERRLDLQDELAQVEAELEKARMD